jgi:site-specific DNA recombinase
MPAQTTQRARYTQAALPHVAALYLRVSSRKQGEDDKASLPTQRKALDDLAAELGYAVDEAYVYEDQFTGEELHQRPALSRLRADAHGRHFAIVLAYNVYALAKNTAHMAILLDEWEQIGVGLQFATESLENTPLGRMILNARTFAAEVEGERRKDRMRRALMTRVERGKPANGVRPNYGYQWSDARGHDGKLLKEKLERNPATWPIVERIWRAGLAGHTLRGIADDLTRDGVPTPTGKVREWDPSTVRYILTNPLYWGKPMALRRVQVAVEPSLRKHYAHKSRALRRPVEEQVPLPADYAPAVVTPEEAAWVAERLRLNQELSTPNAAPQHDDEPVLLLRGLARCGYCGARLGKMRVPSRRADAPRRIVYRCRKGQRSSLRCGSHSIEAHKLDAVAWAKVAALMSDPTLLDEEVTRLRETMDPSAQTLASIDRQLEELRHRIANKRKYAEMVEDDRERAEVAAEVTLLRRDERKLEDERTATLAHYGDWREQLEGLEQAREWCAELVGELDAMDDARRRRVLVALRTEVRLYRAEHDPRADITIHLPYSGTLAATLLDEDEAQVLVESTTCTASRRCAAWTRF